MEKQIVSTKKLDVLSKTQKLAVIEFTGSGMNHEPPFWVMSNIITTGGQATDDDVYEAAAAKAAETAAETIMRSRDRRQRNLHLT